MSVVVKKRRAPESSDIAVHCEWIGKWDELTGVSYRNALHVMELRLIVLNFYGVHGIESCARLEHALAQLQTLNEAQAEADRKCHHINSDALTLLTNVSESAVESTVVRMTKIIKHRAQLTTSFLEIESDVAHHTKIVNEIKPWFLSRIQDAVGGKLPHMLADIIQRMRNRFRTTMRPQDVQPFSDIFKEVFREDVKRNILPELSQNQRRQLLRGYICDLPWLVPDIRIAEDAWSALLDLLT